MKQDYKKIGELLKGYPDFPKQYHYMVDEIDFKDTPSSDDLGPAYYMSEPADKITIHRIYNLENKDEIFLLLMTIIHELAHRIQAKEYPGKYDGIHGKLFKHICSNLGLDPQGESDGNGQRDCTKPFYQWAARITESNLCEKLTNLHI